MEISIKTTDNSALISVKGAVDASSCVELRNTLESHFSRGVREFVLDLSEMDFIDSSGLGVLVGAYKNVRVGQGDVKLAGLQPQVAKVFQLTHLDRVFTILPDASSIKAA